MMHPRICVFTKRLPVELAHAQPDSRFRRCNAAPPPRIIRRYVRRDPSMTVHNAYLTRPLLIRSIRMWTCLLAGEVTGIVVVQVDALCLAVLECIRMRTVQLVLASRSYQSKSLQSGGILILRNNFLINRYFDNDLLDWSGGTYRHARHMTVFR